jgi:N-acetyltransferase
MQLQFEHIVLQNEFVQIVPLDSTHHTKALHDFAIKEPQIWQFSLVSPGGSTTAMDDYIDFAIKEKNKNIAYPFIIIDVKTNTIIGSTRFYDIDFDHKVATIGYTWFGTNYRKNGMNRHCKLLMLSYAFEVWNLERIEFRADINNSTSINAMKAIGCVEEGVLRSHSFTNLNHRRTSMILSILKDEWFATTKALLQSKIKS